MMAIRFTALFFALLSTGSMASTAPAAIELASRCPPSFELTAEGGCKLFTLYDQYDSLQGAGLGGTKTAMPPGRRDGFSPAQIDLGRYLFFDPLLSADHSLSCASCHHPDQGFADGRARSIGITGEEVARSAPSLWNVAFQHSFFWDARAKTLEEQAVGPLFAADEMGNSPQQLLADLNGNADYVRLFKQAFPESALAVEASIELDQVTLALTAFQSSLISLNSRYDQYARGYHQALSQREIEGFNIFRSFVARCSECHTPPLFSNQQVAVIGVPPVEGRPLDIGAEKTYDTPVLKGGFKVPSLRNIASTAPYMHSGQFETLRESVEFYTLGRGHAVPKGVDMQLHWHIWEPDLAEHELDLVVDFLHTLTDESFTPKIPQQLPSGLKPVEPLNTSTTTAITIANKKIATGEQQ